MEESHRTHSAERRSPPADAEHVSKPLCVKGSIWNRLGHSNIAITLQTYSHVLPTMHDNAAATVAALFMPNR